MKLMSKQKPSKNSAVSPVSPWIFLPKQNGNLAIRTQPFYSFFYNVFPSQQTQNNQELKGRIKNQIKTGLVVQNNKYKQKELCKDVINPDTLDYILYNNIPFSFQGRGQPNLFLFLSLCITTLVIGIITSVYWSRLLGVQLEDNYFKTLRYRCLYLSILFIILLSVVSLFVYELVILKFSFLNWFRKYERNGNENVYDFILTKRKWIVWIFLVLWLSIVVYITSAISKRPEKVKNQIAINITLIITLLFVQWMYYNIVNKWMKTACLFLTVFIVGLIVGLLDFN